MKTSRITQKLASVSLIAGLLLLIGALIFSVGITFHHRTFIGEVVYFESLNMTPLLCARILTDVIWTPGYEADSLTRHIIRNTRIYVDDTPRNISHWDTVFGGHDPTILGIRLGAYGAPLTACVDSNRLAEGIHQGRIKVITPIHETLTYAWTFYMDNNHSIVLTPTVQVQ
jgi:hypothetical protein